MNIVVIIKYIEMMKMILNRNILCLLFVFLTGISEIFAAKEKYVTSASNKPGATFLLANGAQLTTRDAQYTRYLNELSVNSTTNWYGSLPTNAPGKFFDKSIKNRVVLSIDHSNDKYQLVPYSVTVYFNITYRKFVGGSFQSTTLSKQLTVSNNYTSGQTSLDKSALEINGGNEMQVDITNITFSQNNLNLSNVNIVLENEIEVERFYYFDASTQYNPLNVKHCSNDLVSKGELEINWLTFEGAEEYELEWLHVNNYRGSKTGLNYNNLIADSLFLDEKLFELNSTRITTTNTFYRIPYVYERGYILYRVRALGRSSINNWEYTIPGLWSTDFIIQNQITNVLQFPNKFPNLSLSGGCNINENFISLHDHLNWQSNLSYAEEGKSKAVVSFADGSLRNRQSVTKTKTEEDIIIGETVYDFQGRPVINFLPVPSDETKIAFVPNFNQSLNGLPYSKEVFDYDQGACFASTPAASVTKAAAKYYSPGNSNVLLGENKYIPNAYGYAFTQVEFTPDNTGRIRNQSGVGPTYKLGSGHETKYLYGIPMQKDMDRLFGSEVGDALRYKKNLVIDANGQASVSYLDPTGKTIATSLAGTPPSNLTSLESVNSVLTTYDLLNKVQASDNSGISNLLDLNSKKLTMSASILVPANGPYTFTYSVIPPNYVENCAASIVAPPNKTITTTGTKCYNCVFDTKISLLNECGQELFSNIIPASPAATNTFVAGTLDTLCPATAQTEIEYAFAPNNASNYPNLTWLQAGSYKLEKTLSINEKVLATYTRNYMDSLQNTCILKLSDFKAAQNDSIDLSGCGITCTTCLDKLGSADTYTNTASCKICLTMDEYNDLKAECEELCNNNSDKCENALVNLEADMSPTGQYGKYSPGGGSTSGGNIIPPAPNTIQPWLFPLSVYNENNLLPIKASVKNAFDAANANFNLGTFIPNWRNPYNALETGAKKFAYLDEAGNIQLIKLQVIDLSINDFLPKIHPTKYSNKQLINGEYYIEPRYLANVGDFIDLWEQNWANSLVFYHPEYSFYEQCVIDQLSNNYDENLIEIDKITEFKSYLTSINSSYGGDEFMYPVGTPATFASGPISGTVVDPYFQSTGSGASELSHIRTAMINYMENPSSPGTYISIWDAAYRIVNCPNSSPSGNICPMTSIPSNHIFNDEEWATFKGLYTSLKQSFQDRVTIRNSINAEAYNQCIGADVFNPFENRFYDPNSWVLTYPSWYSTFWGGFGWGFWPASWSNTSQYYNPQQVCNVNRYHLYSDKSPRFPTAKMLMPDALANSNPPCYDENNLVIPCPQSNIDVINEMGNQADLAAYTNCNQCPTSVNFEQLLKGLATYSTVPNQKDLTNSTTNAVQLTCAPQAGALHKEFTVELAQNLFGAGAPINHVYWQKDNSTSAGKFLKGNFTYANNPNCELFLEMPNYIVPEGIPGVPASYTPFSNTYTFDDVVDFCCIQHNNAPFLFNSNTLRSGVGRFNGQVTLLTKIGDPLYVSTTEPTYRKIVIEGYASCIDFKNCNFQPVCVASKEIKHFQNVMNSLFFSSNSQTNPITAAAYGIADVDFSTAPYSGFFNPVLKDYLNSNFSITSNSSWMYSKVSSVGSQFIAKLYPSGSSTQQCNIYIDLKPGSSFNASQIKRLTGIKPSSVTTAPAGAFTGYALLGNGTTSSWEVITGTVSCIDAGECSQEISSNFQLTGNSNDDPASLGLYNNCASSVLFTKLLSIINSDIEDFLKYLEALGNGEYNGNDGPVFITSINTGVKTYNGVDKTLTYTDPDNVACKYVFSIPIGSNFNFNNITALNSILVSYLPGNYDVHNFTAVVTVTTQASSSAPVITSTATLNGYSSCPIQINSDCISICGSPVNLIKNGDFEQGNVGFNSEYTYDPASSLSMINDTTELPYAPSDYGKHYNVYNIKPIWSPIANAFRSRNSDHTAYLSYNPVSPPSLLSSALTGNGKALAVRAENTTYSSSSGVLPSDIWSQQVNIEGGKTYTFTCYMTLPTGNPYGNQIQFNAFVLINNAAVGYAAVTNFVSAESEGPIWKKISIQIPSSFIPPSGYTNAKISLKGIFSATNTSVPVEPTPNSDLLFLIDDISLNGCGGTSTPNSIACDVPLPITIEVDDNDCEVDAQNLALEEAEYNYNMYLDSLRKNFQAKYIKKCLDVYEEFEMKCNDSEHHFTLYYYDEAGNLVRTIPPQGVNRIPDASPLLAKIKLDRQNNTKTVFTEHTYATTYRYNSLNQLLSQSVPDNNDMNILDAQNIPGVPSSQQVSAIAVNGTNAILTSNDGTNGFLYSFNSASNSWSPITNLNLSNLNDVLFINSTTIYAVGKNGTITKTTDGGSTWNFVSFPDATAELFKVYKHPTNASEIIVYDVNGNNWTSNTNVSNWSTPVNNLNFTAGETLIDLKLNPALTNGWAISNLNKIYKYNGGASWTLTNNVKTVALNKVTGNTGSAITYAVGKDGSVLKSFNNGSTWLELPTSLNLDLVDGEFLNDFKGVFLSSTGNLFATFDGGTTFANASTAFSGGASSITSISIDKIKGFVYCLSATTGNVSVFNLNTPTWSTIANAGLNLKTIKAIGVSANANPKLIVGGNSRVLKSYDFTTSTWSTINTSSIGNTENIISLDFKLNTTNDAEGYVLTDVNTIYNVNLGTSAVISPVTLPNLGGGTLLNAIISKTTNSAFAVGTNGTVLAINTTNVTGSPLSINSNLNLKSVYTNSAGFIVATGNDNSTQLGKIVSFNASATVYNVIDYIKPTKLTSVKESAAGTFICGEDGTVLKYNTTNNDWETLITNSNTYLNTIATSASDVVISGKNDLNTSLSNHILYSTNAGSSWSSIVNNVGNITASYYVGTDIYFTGENKLIAKSTSPASTPALISAGTASSDKFLALASDGTNIKVVGENGLIYGGNNTSTSFAVESTFNPPILNDAKWFDASHIIAVGDNGKILVSENAGTSWKIIPYTNSNNLNSVEILNPTTAVVVGENKTYFQISSCAGVNCNYVIDATTIPMPSTSNNTINYKDISIYNGNIMVVASNGNIFYKPTSLGFNQITSSVNQLNSVHLVDPIFAYAVGNNGNLVKINPSLLLATVIDETLSSFSSSSVFNNVYFKDLTTGYLLGNGGIASKTTNGGATWIGLPGTNVAYNYNVIASTNDNNAFVIGGNSGIAGAFTDYSNEISSRFFYDKLGRLIVSQNSKQFAKNQRTYSYTKYDFLGRIVEVGEVLANSRIDLLPNTNNGQISLNDYAIWLSNAGNVFTEITKTVYDYAVPAASLPVAYDGAGTYSQNNIRNRVSYVTYQDVAGSAINHGTAYSYDIHGNVTTLYQYNAAMVTGNKYKRMDYEYDLISGKVNMVKYQYGAKDQFQHKYEYDADNRITNVYTSKDDIIWEQDAKYFYYKHGPLSRVEIGDNKVQGTDYAYTLQGWIKGVNSNKLTADNDMGEDAKPLVNNTINSFISTDAIGYSLGYHDQDYAAIGQSSYLANNTALASNTKQLFNGNISSMTKSIKQFMDGNGGKPQVMLYNYDQLNRLVNAASFEDFDVAGNAWNTYASSTNYKEFFKYDGNGNIERLKRYDNNGLVMDSLTYQYNTIANGTIKNTNKLGAVQDAVTTAITDDIESGQSFNPSNHALDNYQYDNIGNLTKDIKEKIDNIEWTVYGKIKSIKYNASAVGKSDLVFNYDASGNRVAKHLYNIGTSTLKMSTYYVRDAQGNVMSTYQVDGTKTLPNLELTEQHVYGSSRIGVLSRAENMTTVFTGNEIVTKEAGKKSFELSNHLGNVLTVVSDRKLAVDNNSDNVVDFFLPDVVSATDYGCFGSPMPGRKFTGSSTYRYGMNTQEKDDEIFEGAYTAEYWEYDSRIGKRWNIDPVLATWESPYACFANNPIKNTDVNGDTPGEPKGGKTTVKNEPAGTVNVVQPETCKTCGGTSSGVPSAAISPGGSGSQLPTPSTTETYPLYVDNAPLVNKYGSTTLYAASTSNTSNYFYQVNTAQPGRLDGVNLPSTDITVGAGPISYNVMTGDIGVTGTTKSGYSAGVNPYSVGKGNVQASANGVSYMGNTVGTSGSSETTSYYVMDGKTTAIAKVDKTVTYTQTNLLVKQINGIKVTKTTTPLGGVATTQTTVDSTITSYGASGTYGGFSGGFMTPTSGKQNLKTKAAVNPFANQ